MPTASPTDLRTPVDHLLDALVAAGIADADRVIWLQTPNAFDPEIGTLGPDLYTGMAGMAITFANAWSLTGHPRHRAIARHCILHALAHADAIPEAQRLGFYNGWTGLLYAAAYLHSLLDHEEAMREARHLLARLEAVRVDGEYDIMAGAAGAVLGAAVLAPVFGDAALRLGRSAAGVLRDAAEIGGEGADAVSWRTAGDQLPLTGVSHGNAGIGWALFEWFARTGDPAAEQLAARAFRYEHRYYDVREENWYDLRHYATEKTLLKIPPKSEVAWCHGAGGIALSRLRAYEITRDPVYLAELCAAARTLQADVRATLPAAALPSCLCHGLAGNLDILLTLQRRISRELPFLNDALPFTRELTECARGLTPDFLDPGLMLGTSGLAHYLMRRRDAGIPSVLLPEL